MQLVILFLIEQLDDDRSLSLSVGNVTSLVENDARFHIFEKITVVIGRRR